MSRTLHGLCLLLATSALGCAGWEVKPADRENFARATRYAEGVLKVVDAARKDGGEDSVSMMRDSMASKKKVISEALQKERLGRKEVNDVRQVLASYKQELDDVVNAVSTDDVNYSLAEDEAGKGKLRESVLRASTYLNRIDGRLDEFQKGQKQAFERRLRTTVDALGETLLSFDQEWSRKLEKRMTKLANDPEKAARIKKKQDDMVTAIHGWLKAVDSGLKRTIEAGSVGAHIFETDTLVTALKATLNEDAASDVSPWIGLALTVAVGLVEEVLPEAKEVGEEALWALKIVSDQFTQMTEKYEAAHGLLPPAPVVAAINGTPAGRLPLARSPRGERPGVRG